MTNGLAIAKLYEFGNLYNPSEPGRSLLNEAIALLEGKVPEGGCANCHKPLHLHVGAGNSCPIPYPNYTQWRTP